MSEGYKSKKTLQIIHLDDGHIRIVRWADDTPVNAEHLDVAHCTADNVDETLVRMAHQGEQPKLTEDMAYLWRLWAQSRFGTPDTTGMDDKEFMQWLEEKLLATMPVPASREDEFKKPIWRERHEAWYKKLLEGPDKNPSHNDSSINAEFHNYKWLTAFSERHLTKAGEAARLQYLSSHQAEKKLEPDLEQRRNPPKES
jgi:hypothetical protein